MGFHAICLTAFLLWYRICLLVRQVWLILSLAIVVLHLKAGQNGEGISPFCLLMGSTTLQGVFSTKRYEWLKKAGFSRSALDAN